MGKYAYNGDKMNIQIKNRYTGAVIFEHDCEDNTIRITVEFAVKAKINLRDANLRYANLSNADLSGADLSNANLRYANLSNADLSGANLRDANLSYSKFNYCIGDMSVIFSIQIEKWRISFNQEILNIGCKTFKITEWFGFTDEQIEGMDDEALEWWKKWKDFILMAIQLKFGV